MRTKRFYHGTDIAAARDILTNGFGCNDKVWTCSADCTYMWAWDADITDEDWNDDYEYHSGFQRAFESALTAAAVKGTMERGIVIFALDIPESLIGDGEWVEADSSCENMCGAFEIPSDTLKSFIADGTIKVTPYVAKEAYKPFMRWFYLMGVCTDYLPAFDDDDAKDFGFVRKSVTDDGGLYEALFDDSFGGFVELTA